MDELIKLKILDENIIHVILEEHVEINTDDKGAANEWILTPLTLYKSKILEIQESNREGVANVKYPADLHDVWCQVSIEGY